MNSWTIGLKLRSRVYSSMRRGLPSLFAKNANHSCHQARRCIAASIATCPRPFVDIASSNPIAITPFTSFKNGKPEGASGYASRSQLSTLSRSSWDMTDTSAITRPPLPDPCVSCRSKGFTESLFASVLAKIPSPTSQFPNRRSCFATVFGQPLGTSRILRLLYDC